MGRTLAFQSGALIVSFCVLVVLVPLPVVTRTSNVPSAAPALRVAVICESLTTVGLTSAVRFESATALAPVKFAPPMVIVASALLSTVPGETVDTVATGGGGGGLFELTVNFAELVALVPLGVVAR